MSGSGIDPYYDRNIIWTQIPNSCLEFNDGIMVMMVSCPEDIVPRVGRTGIPITLITWSLFLLSLYNGHDMGPMYTWTKKMGKPFYGSLSLNTCPTHEP